MTAGTVARIAIAPVKALALVHPHAVDVSRTGVAADRRYVLLDAQHRLANGKRLGPLVRIRPEIDHDPESLVLHFPDGRTVGGTVELGESIDAIFYGAERAARVVRGPCGEALSEAAGQPLTLVRMSADGAGLDRADEGGSVSIQSSAALASMAAAAGLVEPVDGRRFRMTFTVDGVEAHSEDTWLGCPVRIGEAVVRPGGNIGRCAVTTQDPDTGIRSLDTLRLLAETRHDILATEPLPFGVWAEVLVPGRVRLGDAVERLPAGWTPS